MRTAGTRMPPGSACPVSDATWGHPTPAVARQPHHAAVHGPAPAAGRKDPGSADGDRSGTATRRRAEARGRVAPDTATCGRGCGLHRCRLPPHPGRSGRWTRMGSPGRPRNQSPCAPGWILPRARRHDVSPVCRMPGCRGARPGPVRHDDCGVVSWHAGRGTRPTPPRPRPRGRERPAKRADSATSTHRAGRPGPGPATPPPGRSRGGHSPSALPRHTFNSCPATQATRRSRNITQVSHRGEKWLSGTNPGIRMGAGRPGTPRSRNLMTGHAQANAVHVRRRPVTGHTPPGRASSTRPHGRGRAPPERGLVQARKHAPQETCRHRHETDREHMSPVHSHQSREEHRIPRPSSLIPGARGRACVEFCSWPRLLPAPRVQEQGRTA